MTKTVLITGASSGIGKEFAHLYAKEKANLVLVSRSRSTLLALKQELEKQYECQVRILVQDIAQEGSAAIIHTKIPVIDVLINNAGIGDFGALVEKPVKTISAMLQLNMVSLTQLCMLYGKDFKTRKSGMILNVSSVVAFAPIPYFATYSASKAYVLSLSQALAAELSEFNVQVTCLCPGQTKTNFFNVAGQSKESGKGMSARTVALIGKRALEQRKTVIIAGAHNKAFAFAQRFLSRKMVLQIVKKMMKRIM
ncbi:MAG: SDR family oxidoreductase [Candidatus Woesearchaeota archaeon]|nr:SDR family oxidoreductase [Candidatus Woesearchaeota archaeon]